MSDRFVSDRHLGRLSLWKRWSAFAAKSRVVASWLLALGACWLARPTAESMAAGVPISLVGLALRAWAAGHLSKNERLATSGPYRYVRNPLYIGSLLAAIGLGVCSFDPLVLAAIAAVFLMWFLPVVGEEESHLREILPEYRAYESRVPRFVPRIGPALDSSTAFDASLFLRNREYSAGLGFAGFVLVLWLKMLLR